MDWHVTKVGVTLGGERFEEHVPVPSELARPRDFVRTAQVLTDSLVAHAIANTPEAISCRKGCGACCRQVVPISQPEARHIADLLGAHMGCFLFQLPPSFHFSRARLDRITAQLDPTRRNVVEFRHRTWWNERVFAAFRANNIVFCSCSGPRLPDQLVQAHASTLMLDISQESPRIEQGHEPMHVRPKPAECAVFVADEQREHESQHAHQRR